MQEKYAEILHVLGVAHGLRDERVLVLDLVPLVQDEVAPVDGPAERLAQVRAVHHVVRGNRHVERVGVGQHLQHQGCTGEGGRKTVMRWSYMEPFQPC